MKITYKSPLLVILIIAFLAIKGNAQTTKTIGGVGADYSTVKLAFDAINAGSISGAIILQITGSTSETASAVLNASGSGGANYTSINIYPTGSGFSISGNVAAPLINLNGADSVIIDGRVNRSGTSKDLIITNTNTGSSASTIQFIESAENNIVKFCTIKGSESSSTKGILFFTTATSGNGNDGNIIDNNNITSDAAGRPLNAVYSSGSAGYENSGITISNNNFYDFLNKGTTSFGVSFAGATTACSVTGNSFFETSSFTPTGDADYNVIRINNTSGTNFTVTGNFIGGRSEQCGSSAWTKTNEKNNQFYAIYLNVSNTSSSSIQNNTIKNFTWSNSGAMSWVGIYVPAGSVNIGNTSANIIGASTGAISFSGGANSTNFYGIYFASTGTINCENNSISSITVANSNSSNATNFYGIYRASSATTSIKNNTIGSEIDANNIQATSTSSGYPQYVIGIQNTGGGTVAINGNTIANLTNGTTNSSSDSLGYIIGISSTAGTDTISNNTIHDLTIANANNSSTNTASISGIAVNGSAANKIIFKNTIYNLSNSNTNFSGNVIGLYFGTSAGTNYVTGNFIHSLSVTGGSSTSAKIYGLKINAGATTYSNNIISLGGNTATTIYGIYDEGAASQTCNLYFNSVSISGTLSDGTTNKSYCYYSNSASNTRLLKNNIFSNARSTTSGSSLHYAAYLNYAVSTLLTLDYNDYYSSGTGGKMGYYNSLDVNTIPLISGFDIYSLSVNPSFINAESSTATDYQPTSTKLGGLTIGTISTDFASTTRANPPTMGAIEGTLSLNVDVYASGVYQNTFVRLKDAFDKINNGTYTGAIVLKLNGNITETSAAVIYQSGYTGAGGTSSYSSINIYPTTTDLTISGNLSTPLIDINNADNVTIDGRVNASGSTKSLTITNLSTSSASGTSTIRLVNDASLNTIKYCTIKGSTADIVAGVVFIGNTGFTTGNDGNTIDNNNITSSTDANRPTNAIYSSGTNSKANTGNTYSNNNIYDFLNRGVASNGINLYSNTTNDTIKGNSFYETSSFVPTLGVTYSIIKINNTSGNSYSITNNYIGGNAALCGGTAWTKTATYDNIFYALNLNIGATATNNVQGNTIKNINWSNSGAAAWAGMIITGGAVNIGTISGNTIGSETGTGSIIVTGGATSTQVYGINVAGSGTLNIQNNKIGSITVANSDNTAAGNFYAIYKSNTSISTINSNTIGSTSTANSIQATSQSSSYSQYVYGIWNAAGSNLLTMNNNTIANLTNSTTNTSSDSLGLIVGISSSSASNVITNNTIYNLTIANANSSSTNTASVCGITLTGTNAIKTVTGNTIYNLSNTYTSFNGNVIGLYFGTTGMYTGNTHAVANNFIHSLTSTGASSTGTVYGIKIYTGQTSYSNNIINLGENYSTTIYGIFETGTASNNNNIYFNSIYIAGSPTNGSQNSYALYSEVSTNTRNFRNNIFENARSNNGATGKHYAAYFNYGVSTSLTLDYNDYYTPGTGGVLGHYNGADVNTIPLITGQDAKSLNINPAFTSAGGTTAANYIPTSDKLEGTAITSFTTDFALTNRNATPTMGAYEVTLDLNVDVYKAGVFQSSNYRLKDAFDKINKGIHTGALEIRIKSNTNETASAVLYQSGYSSSGLTSSYSSIKIYPIASGVKITGNIDAPIVDLNGADLVTIDGRVDTTGSIADLEISNTYVGTNASAFRYVGSAENNIIKYCNVKSSCSNAGIGLIYFASANSGNGNDNNVIEYCNLTNSGGTRPINVIFSSGSTGRENSGNIIRNNNVYNFFNPNATSYGINLSYNTTNWNISGNSFYETETIIPTGDYKYYILDINTGTHTLSNNYLGGSAPLCAGSAFTINSNKLLYFCGIYITGPNTSASTVENNTMKNLDFSSVEDNPWDGFYINSGNVNITGNTIGETTGTGSITIKTPLAVATTTLTGNPGGIATITVLDGGSGYTTAPTITFSAPPGGGTAPTATATISGGVVTGITIDTPGSGYITAPSVVFSGQTNNYSTSHVILNNGSGTVNITNNSIGSINTIGSNYYSHGLETVILRGTTGTVTISNNLLGSLTTANSLNTSSAATSALLKQDIYGIYNTSTGNTVSITGNTIANIANSYNGTNSLSRTRPICATGGTNTVQNNTIRDIVSASAQNSTTNSASIIGIVISATTAGTTQMVTGNTIYNLNSTHATAATALTGIYFSAPNSGTQVVSGNFIHSFSFSSSNISCDAEGIFLSNGLNTCANNIINIGSGLTLGYKINGIWDESGPTNNNSIYFNSIYIGGSVSSGVTSSTSGLWNRYNTSTRNYRNNLFYNARTGGSTGKHYAIRIEGIANATLDYNDYLSTSGTLGRIASTDKADLTTWKAGTSQDVNSLNINPIYTTPGGTDAIDYYTSATIPGVSVSGVSTDFYGVSRGSTPKMGALELNNFIWQGGTSTNFATASNWAGGIVPTDGADIAFASNPDRSCVLDTIRIIRNLTNSQSTDKFIVNGKQLTITGNLNFSNGAKLDATADSSSVIFAGTSAQTIPNGAFLNNIIDTLTINNASGLTLNSDFTIRKAIALIAGNFAIGANTLTFNGDVTAMTGTVTGGSSTNMIIGGTGTSISMPSFLLNNLTINRASGVNMYGDVNIVGVLTLTNGTLTIGSNTLTLSNSPVRTSGLINVSNDTATIAFINLSAITLPASIFSSTVNNLTINGTGGVTASSDFTLNGILNLQSSNPSAIKGSLHMWDGVALKTLTMGANATTIGVGDVTGIVKRTSFVASTDYTFGNQFTTMTMSAGGTMPTDVSFKISIGAAPSWKSNAVQRNYDVIRTGGSGTTVTLALHYLDSELQANSEANLVQWDYHTTPTIKVEEHGKANQNTSENWVAISNRNITYFATAFGVQPWGLSDKISADFTWEGTPSSDWNDPNNWSGGIVPNDTSAVIIPDASTTLHDPILPDSIDNSATVKTIIIQPGGILEGGTATTLTVKGSTGAWLNLGTFNAGTSTVVFTNANATIADPTNFYNLTVATGAGLTPESGNIMRIAGTLTNNGTLRAALLPNTIEFNGTNQTIINPNGLTTGYYNLILSGNGVKTLPATNLSIAGDFTLSDTASTIATSILTINGNFTIGSESSFETGVYNHLISGNFDNNGTFIATSGGTITMNGTSAQTIFGAVPSTFDNLTIDNSQGVTILENTTVSDVLTLTNGNLSIGGTLLTLNGTISNTSGFLDVAITSSLSIGGTSAITLPNNLYSNTPSLNNLIINRSGGVTLGNQNMTINGTLDLTSGIFNINANTLTITGNSPTRSTGSLDVSNVNSTLLFTNSNTITLPASFFNGNVNNLTINSTGGIIASSDFTINGILNLQSTNPISTKGSLDMWDGSSVKTLTMGANATTIGLGDVTGIIKRTTINPGVTYTFGNLYTTAYFPNEGTLPSQMSAKISIGNAPSWRSGAIQREIEIIQTGGSGTKAVFSCHYLDSEINGNNEGHLVLWTKYLNLEYGRSAYNMVDNWVSLSNVNVAFFPSSWTGTKNLTLDEYSDATTLTWNGSLSDSWTSVENWTPNAGPSAEKNIIIPDASTTPNLPILPAFTEIKTLTIEAAGILNSTASAQLTVNGGNSAWNNTGGTFNFGTSNVIFTNAAATISGSTNFYNITIDADKALSMENGSVIKISGTLTNNGSLRAVNVAPTTVEYNGGDQTVLNPNGSTTGYYNLTLSGSGTKTLPVSDLTILGDLSIDGTTTVNANSTLNISGNLTIGNNATFNTGNYNHQIDGNITNYGTFNPSANYVVTLNGSSAQTIGGTSLSTFGELTISNSNGVTLNNDISITKTLQLTSGIIHTGSNNVILTNTANSIIGASSSNYIDGNCRKIGNTAFTFPVGNNGKYAPIGISAANGGGNANDYFTASYFNSMPHDSGLDSTQHDTTIVRISGSEYWQLDRNGTNNVSVTLSWGSRSGGVSSLNELTVAHWNGSKWEDKINSATTGDTASGTITSGIITSFSPFTLASKSRGANLLPVSLIYFNAKCENNQALLTWATASEINNNYFEIQKSSDGKSWEVVSKVNGAGNSNQVVQYAYLDKNTENDMVYYRLKQVDFDGNFEYSSILTFNNCTDFIPELIVYPNPTVGNVYLHFDGEVNNVQSIEIYNTLGEKVYYSKNFQSKIDISNQPNGVYFIHVNLISNQIVEKIVLQQ